MPRRRLRRKQAKAQRHETPAAPEAARTRAAAPIREARTGEPTVVVREASHVVRLAYTRTQAAAALGISRSTFDRHVLPFVETIEIGSGSKLIPVDELDRYAADERRPAQGAPADRRRLGRPAVLAYEAIAEIRTKRDAGASLAQIARELNATGRPTAHGGALWWPSTVRAVLDRGSPEK